MLSRCSLSFSLRSSPSPASCSQVVHWDINSISINWVSIISISINSTIMMISVINMNSNGSWFVPVTFTFKLSVLHFKTLSRVLSASVYTVVCLSLERLLHLCRPHWSNKVINTISLPPHYHHHHDFQGAFIGYILPVLVFSTCYNFPKFLEFTTIHHHLGSFFTIFVFPYIHLLHTIATNMLPMKWHPLQLIWEKLNKGHLLA